MRRSIGYVSQAGGAFSAPAPATRSMDHGMLYGLKRAVVERARQASSSRSWTSTACGRGCPRTCRVARSAASTSCMGLIHEPHAGLPRRADHRPRPAGARQPVGAHRATCATERGATVFLTTHYLDEADALSRPHRDHRPGPHRGQRHRRQPQGPGLRRPRRPRGRRPHQGDATPPRSCATRHRGRGRGRRPARARPRSRAPAAPCPACSATSTAPASTLDSIEVHRPTLDDVFLTLTGRSLRDAEAGTGAEPRRRPPTTSSTAPEGARR